MAVKLLAISFVLATRARTLEQRFGGLDKMYRSHRHVAVAGYLLLVAHVAVVPWRFDSPGGVPAGLIAFGGLTVLTLLSIGPRLRPTRRIVTISYSAWKHTHRLVGVFFIFSIPHMFLVDSLIMDAFVALGWVLAAYVVGVAAYFHRLLISRIAQPRVPYTVRATHRLDDATLEVVLTPDRDPIHFTAGQFVFVHFKQPGLREPHPFTVASSPRERDLRLVVKATGDFTRRLHDQLQTGRSARVEGAYGMLDYRRGTPDQIWIAGGIGITPMLAWLRDHPSHDHHIDLYYTVRHPGDALFDHDIAEHAARHPNLNYHLIISSTDGTLTAEDVAADTTAPLTTISVYMCGPVALINAFEQGFLNLGVAASNIHYEEFAFR